MSSADEKRLQRKKVEEGTAPVPLVTGDEYSIRFGPVLIDAGSVTDLLVLPAMDFRVDRLIIPSNVGSDFTVRELSFGGNNQLLPDSHFTNIVVPGIIFSEKSFGIRMRQDICQKQMPIKLVVRNVSNTPKTFMAVVLGRVIINMTKVQT